MATSQAASVVERIVGHDDSAVTAQDVSTYSGNDTGETMKALCWMGKNSVQVLDVARPKIIEPTDVILKVTGSTVCGSDLHLLHGEYIHSPDNNSVPQSSPPVLTQLHRNRSTTQQRRHSRPRILRHSRRSRLISDKSAEGQAICCLVPDRLW